MSVNRRLFVVSTAVIGQALLADAGIAAPAIVDPSDPQATSLGYTPDAEKVPPAFVTKRVAGAHCGNCALFQGKGAAATGPCPLFGGKSVQGNGWCSSWVAKA